MFSSCRTCFSMAIVPCTEANALCAENDNADAIIPNPSSNVRSFIFLFLSSFKSLETSSKKFRAARWLTQICLDNFLTSSPFRLSRARLSATGDTRSSDGNTHDVLHSAARTTARDKLGRHKHADNKSVEDHKRHKLQAPNMDAPHNRTAQGVHTQAFRRLLPQPLQRTLLVWLQHSELSLTPTRLRVPLSSSRH